MAYRDSKEESDRKEDIAMHALKLTTLQIIKYAGLLGLDSGELKECADDEEFIILVEEGILPPNVIREAPKPNSYELATQLVVMAPGVKGVES